MEKRALRVPFESGARSSGRTPGAGKPAAAVSRLLDANASLADESAAGLRHGIDDMPHGIDAGMHPSWLQDDATYLMLRDGFSKNGEDVRVLQMLIHDLVVRPIHENAAGGGRRGMDGSVRPVDGSVRPGVVSSDGGFGDRGAAVGSTSRAGFVEIGLPFDGCCPRSAPMLRVSMLSRARTLQEVGHRASSHARPSVCHALSMVSHCFMHGVNCPKHGVAMLAPSVYHAASIMCCNLCPQHFACQAYQRQRAFPPAGACTHTHKHTHKHARTKIQGYHLRAV